MCATRYTKVEKIFEELKIETAKIGKIHWDKDDGKWVYFSPLDVAKYMDNVQGAEGKRKVFQGDGKSIKRKHNSITLNLRNADVQSDRRIDLFPVANLKCEEKYEELSIYKAIFDGLNAIDDLWMTADLKFIKVRAPNMHVLNSQSSMHLTSGCL